jgi:hypothetical protein
MTQNPYQPSDVPPPLPPGGYQRPKGMSTGAKVAIGCGIAALVAVILICVTVWYVVANFKNFASDLATTAITQTVQNAQIPQDQKQRIIARVRQLNTDFKDGRVTLDQVTAIADALANGPILHVGSVLFVDAHYLQPSSLSDQEKTDGRRSLERLARGVFEKTIDPKKLDTVMEPVTEPDPKKPGSRVLKQNPSPDDLREFLKRAKAEADAAGVPDEAWKVDLADELDKAIDSVLQSPPTPTPVPTPAPEK